MVLFPLDVPGLAQVESANPLPIWQAIDRRQRQPAQDWRLVAQPDHAFLSGDLAAAVSSEYFPTLDDKTIEAIRLHDQGWAEFDRAALNARSVPLSFLDATPVQFLSAWRGSIAAAEQSSPLGAVLVGRHFLSLAEMRLQATPLCSSEERAQVETFIREETERQTKLTARCGRSAKEIDILLEVLQFCDLLSLYLCCGAEEWSEFPQRFRGKQVRVHKASGTFRTQPALFGDGATMQVKAEHAPTAADTATLSFLLF